MTDYPSIAIVNVYFGRFPDHFDLWLQSCLHNSDFHWHIFTDCDWSDFNIPKNVYMHRYELSQFIANASKCLRVKIDFSAPYKLCDFKPTYGVLFKAELLPYQFWGHCDLDMIFGDLRRFIPLNLFEKYLKIFSVGHLTLYRNCEIANTMFMRKHPDLDWIAVLTNPIHMGFDEHIGINRYWHHYKESHYENESIIADIRPDYCAFELGRLSKNYHRQVFFFENGKIFQGYYRKDKWNVNEFMYIHFQKRKFVERTASVYSDSFFITPFGFIKKDLRIPSIDEVYLLNPIRYFCKWSEMKFRIKEYLKEASRR